MMATRRADHDPPSTGTKPKRQKQKPIINPEELKARKLYTPAEAAWLLHMSESKLYRLLMNLDPATRKPKIHSVKIGAKRYIPPRALDLFIEGLS
jgi:Helix-turn-helix domain